MKKIIALAGEISCGKGTVVKYLIDKYGAESVRFSTILRDITNRLYLDESRDNLQKLSTSLRQTFGEDVLSKTIAEDAKRIQSDLVLLDGARRESDIKYLKEIPGFQLVYIDADPKVCYERITKRGENVDDSGKTFEEFLSDREKEAEKQIRDLKKIANHIIDNSGDEKALYDQIDSLIGKLS